MFVTKALEVAGLRDGDLTKAFARMVRQKLDNEDCQKRPAFPRIYDDVITKIENCLKINLLYVI